MQTSSIIVHSHSAWFVADHASIFSDDTGAWYVHAQRLQDTDAAKEVIWAVEANNVGAAMQIVTDSTCNVYASANASANASATRTPVTTLALCDISSVHLCTFVTDLGKRNVFEVSFNDGDESHPRPPMKVGSWMTSFVDAWRSNELYMA